MKNSRHSDGVIETDPATEYKTQSLSHLPFQDGDKILKRVRERFENEVEDGPHVNHTAFQDHSDTYTP